MQIVGYDDYEKRRIGGGGEAGLEMTEENVKRGWQEEPWRHAQIEVW